MSCPRPKWHMEMYRELPSQTFVDPKGRLMNRSTDYTLLVTEVARRGIFLYFAGPKIY